ncbi:MAG: hypothetical protein RR523_08200 [Cetobacterium sp.]|uniref:hypothetical protein n=1 Tax=Cetobacterium sp. TaxID=2071632 RepID=UPI002FC6D55D
MNQTNYIILKLLLQQPLEEKEILKYLNLNLFTLKKAIIQLNNKLKSLNLPTIEYINNIYQIRLSKSQKEFFYSSCSEYSQEQRCIYLTLKLLINKTLNLEYEKGQLNISRPTIDRDIAIVKNNLIEKNLFIISKKWEGLFLNIKNENNYYEHICEILIVLYSEYRYLPGVLKTFLVTLEQCEVEHLVSEFFDIYDEFNIQMGNISLRYFLALNVCFNLPLNFYLSKVLDYIKTINKDTQFQNIHNTIITKFHLKDDYALYVSMNVYETLYKKFCLENYYKPKIEAYCKYFNLNLTNENYYLLELFLYVSNFRYKHNLYEVKNIYLRSSFDKILLNHLVNFLKNINIYIFYGDLLELLDFTKFFLLTTNINNNKNILILKKDINIVYFSNLEHKLKLIYPNFSFDIKPYSYIYILKEANKTYDLVLSDIVIDIDLEYKLCQVNTSLTTLINEYLIEDILNTIK